jgi:hypothetical protein
VAALGQLLKQVRVRQFTQSKEEKIFITSTLLHFATVETDVSSAAIFSFSLYSVNKATCEYTGVIKFNAPNANVPFLTPEQCAAAGPPPPDTKAPPSYKFSTDFYKVTGFDHLGMDWQPCGHPAISNFGKPHFDFHLYRITSAQRDLMSCVLIPGAPVCAFPGGTFPDRTPFPEQTTFAGKKFFAVGTVTADPTHPDYGKIANMPDNFQVDLGSAVPHSSIHVYDINGAVPVDQWTNPVSIMGSYDSQIVHWEPMFPYTFVSGTTS